MKKRIVSSDPEFLEKKRMNKELAHQKVLERMFFNRKEGVKFCECGDYFYSYIDQNSKTKQCRKCREGFNDEVF